jgi:predicted amidohydrolase
MSNNNNTAEVLVARDGVYPVVPLKKDDITIVSVQSRVVPVDENDAERMKRDNLLHMLDLIDAAATWMGPKDLIQFHEFPITGFSFKWTREDLLKVAIEIPGVETQAIGERAKRYGTYIVFGSYAKDPNWPDHILSITTIIGPDGNIIDKHWKPRNIKGVFAGFEVITTTIYDVLDEFVEMYGRDAVIPVTRTDIGNLATTATQYEPELIRAYALKGAEIMLRSATSGADPIDVRAGAMHNNMYTTLVNNSISRNPGPFFEDVRSGGSAIYGPDGKVIDKANSVNETGVIAKIPIAKFREGRRLPRIHPSLYGDLYSAYQEAYPPNLMTSELPNDGFSAAKFLKDKNCWG